MRVVTLMDKCLVECWKWLLVIMLFVGIAVLVFFKTKWK